MAIINLSEVKLLVASLQSDDLADQWQGIGYGKIVAMPTVGVAQIDPYLAKHPDINVIYLNFVYASTAKKIIERIRENPVGANTMVIIDKNIAAVSPEDYEAKKYLFEQTVSFDFHSGGYRNLPTFITREFEKHQTELSH